MSRPKCKSQFTTPVSLGAPLKPPLSKGILERETGNEEYPLVLLGASRGAKPGVYVCRCLRELSQRQ